MHKVFISRVSAVSKLWVNSRLMNSVVVFINMLFKKVCFVTRKANLFTQSVHTINRDFHLVFKFLPTFHIVYRNNY